MNSANNNFLTVHGCTCEGYDQVYECTVDRDSATLWRGTAFNCPDTNNEIFFLYRDLGIIYTNCNEGVIRGHAIRASNNSYTSRLSIFVTSEMNGSNISCFSDGAEGTILIGSADLIITTGNNVMYTESRHLIITIL